MSIDWGRWETLPNGYWGWVYPCKCGATIRVWTESGSVWDHWQHGDGEALLVVDTSNGMLPMAVPRWLEQVHQYERAARAGEGEGR